MKKFKGYKWLAAGLLSLSVILVVFLYSGFKPEGRRSVYRSPETVSFSPGGNYLAVNDNTLNTLYLVSLKQRKIVEEFSLDGKAPDMVWLDEENLMISEYETGRVLQINIETGKTVREYEIGPNPFQLAINRDELWIGQYGLNQVKVMDLSNGAINHTIDLTSMPWDVRIVPGKNLVLVVNQLPGYAANEEKSATTITVIDLITKEKIREIPLPHGSSNMRCLEVTSDEKWAYTVHTRGKTAIPTSQLENGWVNTNMLSIIDLDEQEWYTSVILDKLKEGAANPWGLVCNEKDGSLLISLEGVNELARIAIRDLHGYLDGGEMPQNLMKNMAKANTAYNVWEDIKNDPSKRTILKDQISALYAAGLMHRESLPLKAPRGIDLSPDGKLLAVAGYYSGAIVLKNLENESIETLSLGNQSEPNQVRRGEIWFHDATTSMESWLTCATCHPEGRNDGLNWDLLNDGIGNPKNTKSLVLSPQTPPVMWSGVRSRAEIAVRAGFHFINFFEASDERMSDVRAYLASLEPEKSPYLGLSEIDGNFAESVERGKSLFNSQGCIDCHKPPLYTNKETYEFEVADERGINRFDVPTLKELWRRGPYWHDGRKSTLEDLLTDPSLNPCGSSADKMNSQEIKDLSNFLLTL